MSDNVVESAWNVLQAIHPTLPFRHSLGQQTIDADAAQKRGYYLPDEDDRLRDVYRKYLETRAILWEVVNSLRPRLREQDPYIFSIAFCAASALVRTATYLIEIAKDRPVVHQKLDEAEPRFRIPRKTFTSVYRSATSPATAWRFSQARKFYLKNRDNIIESLTDTSYSGLIQMLEGEAPSFPTKKRTAWSSMVDYRLHSLNRRTQSGYHKVMFHLFRVSGSAIAGKRQPFARHQHKGKMVRPEIIDQMQKILRPGDIIITRHHDALSNLFLPGFWPHAAFHLGTPEDRRALGLPDQGNPNNPVLEAKKDGVKLRPLSETLSVDAFVVLRPDISTQDLAAVIDRALTHEGKLYDFLFDFKGSERLACTEVIYRAFHGTGSWQLQLVKQSGRLTLPAGNLIQQILHQGHAHVFCIFGALECPLTFGKKAGEILENSLKM